MNPARLQQLFQFLEKAPDDSFTLYSIAYEYLQLGELNKSVEYFQKLRSNDPNYIGLYYHLGKTLLLLDQAEEAKETYQTGIKLSQEQGDKHAEGELQRALQQQLDEEMWDD